MNGQWIGHYTGTYAGYIIVNIDNREGKYQGVFYLNHDIPDIPGIAAAFNFSEIDGDICFRTDWIQPINKETGLRDLWVNIKGLSGSDVIVPEYADVTGKWEQDTLSLTWQTNLDTQGKCKLRRSNGGEPSELPPLTDYKDWLTFKELIGKMDGRRYLFRGQSQPWRLRSSFHRRGRADLVRFLNEDIPILHRYLSSRTKHVFDLEIPVQNGAFFNLVQHHGYPTPLLDWTYSPYVAAFFAYRSITNTLIEEDSDDAKVRIFIFDQEQWKVDFKQRVVLEVADLHLSINEFPAIENDRLIPQQSVSMVTNIDDIEGYVQFQETESKKYLWAIDLPAKERKKVMQELRYMGITAGSLFPGLDGACEELRERNFDI